MYHSLQVYRANIGNTDGTHIRSSDWNTPPSSSNDGTNIQTVFVATTTAYYIAMCDYLLIKHF